MLDKKNLLYRRQFVIGPRYVKELNWWNKIPVTDQLFITVHPDLNYAQVKKGNRSLTLLGYLIDPFKPKFDDTNILEELISKSNTNDNLIENCNKYGGRWILIFDDSKKIMLFNDPAGLKQVYYTNNSTIEFWCGSQPNIITMNIQCTFNNEAYNDLKKSGAFNTSNLYFWPGNSSPYLEIKRLIPNHYLDIDNRLCHRYWPNKELKGLSLEEGAYKCKELLKRLIKGVYERFKLAHAITSGLDSRLLLAASKDIARNIYYYTAKRKNFNRLTPDIRIPKELLKKLSLSHHIIDCSKEMSIEFREIYENNVMNAHESGGRDAQGFFNNCPSDRISMIGNVSETVRASPYFDQSYDLSERYLDINEKLLASKVRMDKSIFAIKNFKIWLKDCINLEKKYGINIIDLFYLEQLMGGWLSMIRTESDIVQEVFTPYNCRLFLEYMFAIDEKYRKPPEYIIYKKMILSLWPEVMQMPVNPVDFIKVTKDLVRKSIKLIAKTTGTYYLYKFFKSLRNR